MPPAPARLLACAAALALAGCQLGPRTVAAPHLLPSGDWAVVDVRPGPLGVRDPGAAMASFGQVLRFEPAVARSGTATCAQPQYVVSLMAADRFLRNELGLRAADLGLYRFQDLRISEVFCEGRRWRALGGEVLWIDYDRAYAVRDGTLYQLRRVGTPG
jgi:hypothetical protein